MPHRTVPDNVTFSQEVRGNDKRERHENVLHAIAVVDLNGWNQKYPTISQAASTARRTCPHHRRRPDRLCAWLGMRAQYLVPTHGVRFSRHHCPQPECVQHHHCPHYRTQRVRRERSLLHSNALLGVRLFDPSGQCEVAGGTVLIFAGVHHRQHGLGGQGARLRFRLHPPRWRHRLIPEKAYGGAYSVRGDHDRHQRHLGAEQADRGWRG